MLHPSKKTPNLPEKKELAQDFQGSTPTPFVGRFGYPHVSFGLMTVPDGSNSWMYDAPRFWSQQQLSIADIVQLRSQLLNAKTTANVNQPTRILDLSKEVGTSEKAVDVEVHLKEKPKFRLQTYDKVAPSGPNAEIKNAQATSNISIPKRIDAIISDSDLKAGEGMSLLFKKGINEHTISKILSVGELGIKKERKLVPTRWSITATDDIIGKNILEEIKDYPETDIEVWKGGHLGNEYYILLLPGPYRYELIEIGLSKNKEHSVWTDYEGVFGRKEYAYETAGGYYAARLPILEKLKEKKRQASILCIRFIIPEYDIPLGVWVVREAVRKASQSTPIQFEDKEIALSYLTSITKKKYGIQLDSFIKKSKLLKEYAQPTLEQFF